MAKMPAALLARRVLYVLACLLPVWAVVAYFTGGVGWMIGPIRLSSRQPLRPLVIGLALAGWYAWSSSRAERDDDGRWLHHWAARALLIAVPLAVVLAMYLGVHDGSFAAAGSDSYGYVSQARLWLSGIPRVEQPWVQDFAWRNREWVFAPLGYRPFSPDGTIVPTYPPGLPMIMAVFLGILGENGPYYVVPILGALTVWLTYVLGRESAGSRTAGALAALLLLASPVFLTHLLVPMSDVPAAAGWTLVAVLVLKQRPLAAGLVSGLTLLIRPNLVLMALVPVFAWQKKREPLIRYAVGVVPGLVAIMVINTLLYGGPLSTGYGSLFEAYSLSSTPLNVRNYVVWLIETQTPLILLALVPLFVRPALREDGAGLSRRACLAAIVGLMFLSYLFYATFNHWFYLRFLLPAYPALFVLLAASIRWLATKLPREVRVSAAALVCAVMVPFGVNVGKREGIFNVSSYEQRHIRAAREIASRTPAEAVVLSVQHSGSVRYYANRITLRYDWLENGALDAALRDLAAKGRRAYLVVDDWEEKEFRDRFSPGNRAGRLDWAPIARVPGSPEVRIFEMQDGGPAPAQ
jgi:hypothetical protein